jgi:hypothetical protein
MNEAELIAGQRWLTSAIGTGMELRRLYPQHARSTILVTRDALFVLGVPHVKHHQMEAANGYAG